MACSSQYLLRMCVQPSLSVRVWKFLHFRVPAIRFLSLLLFCGGFRLQELTLGGGHVSDVGLQVLGRSLPALRTLVINQSTLGRGNPQVCVVLYSILTAQLGPTMSVYERLSHQVLVLYSTV